MRKKSTLKDLVNRQTKIIVGLNSGTSADGIDAAVIRIFGEGYVSKVKFLAGATYRFTGGLRDKILRYAEPDFRDGVKWLELDAELAGLFAGACRRIVKKAGFSLDDIDLIGSHGQTIRHLPQGHSGAITYQISDPARIAAATGITTVGDFRIADTSAGGQGAPLTPIVNAILFGDSEKPVIVLNIGGIANITAIEYKRGKCSLFGCDTGPGNMLVDYLAKKLYGILYDRFGRIALSGRVNSTIVTGMLRQRFFNESGPKSTGRERFGKKFADNFIIKCRKSGLKKADMIATASLFTVAAIEKCISLNKLKVSKIILTGGGAKNRFFKEYLKTLGKNVKIELASEYGYPEDHLEAISFAVLANEAICSRKHDLKNVTGSKKPVVPGKICQA